MAVSLTQKYRRPTDYTVQQVSITVDIVKFRPQSAARNSLGDTFYLKVTGGTAAAWYRKMDGHIMDALRAYALGIDGGTSVDANNGGTPTTSLGVAIEGTITTEGAAVIEGILTQLEKPAAPTSVDATAAGSGNIVVQFVASASDSDYVAGYYFFHSADGITWTRIQSLGSGVANASLVSVTVGGVAKKQYTMASGTTGAKYIGVTAAAAVDDASEFPESLVGQKSTTITIT